MRDDESQNHIIADHEFVRAKANGTVEVYGKTLLNQNQTQANRLIDLQTESVNTLVWAWRARRRVASAVSTTHRPAQEPEPVL